MIKKRLKKHRIIKPKHNLRWCLRWDYANTRTPVAVRYTQRDWNQTLVTRINQTSIQIHISSGIKPADTVVIGSVHVLNIFQTLDYFHYREEATHYIDNHIGTLSGTYKVLYKPELNENAIYVYDSENDSGGMGKITIDNLNI